MDEDEVKEYKIVIDVVSDYYTAMDLSEVIEHMMVDINIDGCTSCTVSTVEERKYTELKIKE